MLHELSRNSDLQVHKCPPAAQGGDPAYTMARLTRAIFPLGISPFSCFSAARAAATGPPLRSFQLAIDIQNVLPSSYPTIKPTLPMPSPPHSHSAQYVSGSI